jgi:hypothetical protein
MKSHLLAAAISGILFGVSGLAHAETQASRALGGDGVVALDETGKHGCKGQNQCKGQGGCKTEKHGCKSQNQCKGQGGCRTDGGKDADKSGKSACSGPSGCGSTK